MLNSTFCLCTVPPFDRESQLVTAYGLYRLERAGIPVWRELSDKNRDFQAVLRVREPDANLAIIKWLSSGQKANIQPLWKNLLLILRLINLDILAKQIETYLSGTAGTEETLSNEKGLPLCRFTNPYDIV